MKKIIGITLSLVCISLFTFGQPEAGKNKPMKLDLNKDGVLDREEFNKKASQQVKAIDLRMDKTFDRIDANKDGVLDKAEMRKDRMQRTRGTRGKQAGKMRKKGNRNMQKGTQGKKIMRQKRVRTKEQFNNLDRNGNGVVNFREFKKAAKARPNYSRANAKRIFNRIDNNQDGILNAQEFAKAKMKRGNRKMRGQRKGRGMRR